MSVSALVAKICKTLDLPVDWSLWEDEDWAVAEWREGVAGSPYAAAVQIPPAPLAPFKPREEASRLEAAAASP